MLLATPTPSLGVYPVPFSVRTNIGQVHRAVLPQRRWNHDFDVTDALCGGFLRGTKAAAIYTLLGTGRTAGATVPAVSMSRTARDGKTLTQKLVLLR